MALRSQMARQGIRWRYMAGGSSKRRGRLARWRWGILSLVILLLVGVVVWMSRPDTPGTLELAQSDADPASGGDATGPQSATYTLPPPGQDHAAANQARQPEPARPQAMRQVDNRPALPADRVWTLGGSTVETGNTPSATATTVREPVRTNPPTPAPTPAPVAVTPAPMPSRPVSLNGGVEDGFSLIEQGRRVEGRKLLSKLLVEGSLTPAQAQKVRDVLTVVNNTLIYSPRVEAGDPLVSTHVVQRGDRLVNIAIRYKIPHQFIEKVNRIDANRIQLDQKIKVIHGPFHATVTKSAYRMDVYLKDPADGQMVYIRSFQVGLGAEDSTPLGAFVVRPRSKVVNPGWTNPRTGETFSRDDPKNPIGEYWMGLEGVQAATADLAGYGIHGTIDQDSIGTQSSMGCIRLRDEDVAQIYFMLWEGETTVSILP